MLFSSASKVSISRARDDTLPEGFDLRPHSRSSAGGLGRASQQKNVFGRRMGHYLCWLPEWIWPEAASEGAGATEVTCAFPRVPKRARFARMRRPVSRIRNHCKLQALRNGSFASTEHLFVGSHKYTFTKCQALRCSAYQAPPRSLADAIRVAAATRTSFSSSN